jgi:hypothetical protein
MKAWINHIEIYLLSKPLELTQLDSVPCWTVENEFDGLRQRSSIYAFREVPTFNAVRDVSKVVVDQGHVLLWRPPMLAREYRNFGYLVCRERFTELSEMLLHGRW